MLSNSEIFDEKKKSLEFLVGKRNNYNLLVESTVSCKYSLNSRCQVNGVVLVVLAILFRR